MIDVIVKFLKLLIFAILFWGTAIIFTMIFAEIHCLIERYLKFKKLTKLLDNSFYEHKMSDEIQRLFVLTQDLNKQLYDVIVNMDKHFCFNFEIYYPFKQNDKIIISDIKQINNLFQSIIFNHKNIYHTITHFNKNYNDDFKFAINIYRNIFKFKDCSDFDFEERCHFLYYYDTFVKNLNKLHKLKEKKKNKFIDKISNISLIKDFKVLAFTVYYPGYQCTYIKYQDDIKLVEEYKYEYQGNKNAQTLYTKNR